MIRGLIRTAYRSALEYAYAGRNYKLLLREGLNSLNRRTLELGAVLDHFGPTVRPIRIREPFGETMLVIAPHQDDEIIGCGGALALAARAGKPVHIIMLQDGADEHDGLGMPREALRDLRNAESSAAAEIGGASISFLNFPDLCRDAQKASAHLRDHICRDKVDVVFTPWLLDTHQDHRTTNRILAKALRDVPHPVRVLCYEVWGLCLPNVVVVIDEVIETKRRMLECFRFANSAIDYTHTTIGLSMYRSRLLGSGTARHVEAFTEMPGTEFVELVRRLDGSDGAAE